jgi:hypothetical protein
MSETWVLIQQVSLIVVSIAMGGLLVPAINYVKDVVGASGNAARLITLVFSLIVALACWGSKSSFPIQIPVPLFQINASRRRIPDKFLLFF